MSNGSAVEHQVPPSIQGQVDSTVVEGSTDVDSQNNLDCVVADSAAVEVEAATAMDSAAVGSFAAEFIVAYSTTAEDRIQIKGAICRRRKIYWNKFFLIMTLT